MNIDAPVYEQTHSEFDDSLTQHRATREFVPAEKKDDKYWFKRVRNNVSARKSRMKRKAMDKVMERKLLCLQKENLQLRNDLAALNTMYLRHDPKTISGSFSKKTGIDDMTYYTATQRNTSDDESSIYDGSNTSDNNDIRHHCGDRLDTYGSSDSCGSSSSGSNNQESSSHEAAKHIKVTISRPYDVNDSNSVSSSRSGMDDFRRDCVSPITDRSPESGSPVGYSTQDQNKDGLDSLPFHQFSTLQGNYYRPNSGYLSLPLNHKALIINAAHIPYGMQGIENDISEEPKIRVPHKIRIKERIHSAFTKKH